MWTRRGNALRRVAVALVIVAGACGSSGAAPGAEASAAQATRQIEDELATDIDLGPLVADCEPPADGEPGTPFACSATTTDDRVVRFAAELVEPGEVAVRSTNLLVAADLRTLEQEASRALSEISGTSLPDGALVCPSEEVLVVEVDSTIDCELANPRSKATDRATITITRLDPIDFDVELG